MAIDWLLHFWNEWAIQILVLVSFALQVFLLVFGDARRRSSSAVLRVALWLAYQLADPTAVYTLGHLSVFFVVDGSRSGEHQLPAFWAPFLLLHLGGQDTISAYALEDNSLWLRHLQVLVVQALGAAYVLYKHMAGSGASLLLASVAMFVAGLVKYGERIWALRCGSMSSIRSSLNNSIDGEDEFSTDDNDETAEETLRRAYCKLNLCKSVFIGLKSRAIFTEFCFGGSKTVEAEYKLVEMQLSLMYDIPYTKAAVIHTWYGFWIRFISLLGTAAAFLLFQLSRRDGYSRGRDGYRYSRVDVIVSYVLLVGASVLEAMSHCRALLSSRTCESLRRRRYWIWNRASQVITSLRRLVQPARRRLWSCSIGQFNLLHLCTCDRAEPGLRLARKLGLEDWWYKLHFSGTFSPTESLSTLDLKELVFQELQLMPFNKMLTYNSRGCVTLERMGAYKGYARWSVSNDHLSLDQSILVWHIATDFYIHESKAEHEPDRKISKPNNSTEPKLIEATRVISNYMVFLVMRKPDLLPGRLHHDLYLRMREDLEGVFWSLEMDDDWYDSVMASRRSQNPYRKLKDLFNHKGPDHSSIPQRAMLAKALFKNFKEESETRQEGTDVEAVDRSADIRCAFLLAQELLGLGRPDTLKLIFGVWVEMMLYAAEYCTRESHLKQLNNGGEFITIVWLLAYHNMCTIRKVSD